MKHLHSLQALANARLVNSDQVDTLRPIAARYAVAVTETVASLIDKSDPADPVARQFIPSADELRILPEERADPIGDEAHSPVPGIVHRHKDRVLLKIVNVCPVYCRFCFRRESVGPGGDNALSEKDFETALAYIAGHPEIWEVILTGGDPFMLSPRRIADIAHRLAAVDHVKIVRWHSRVPAVDPARISDDLVAALHVPGATTIVALHADHPREFSAAARAASSRLIDAGIPMLGQSVLLKGVNDDIDTLEALMRSFVETRIKPYYLHHPDLAPGTSHFRVTIDEGLKLMRELRGRVSGLCVPHYVIDIPGGYAKVPLESHNVMALGDGRYRIRDHDGVWHQYPPDG